MRVVVSLVVLLVIAAPAAAQEFKPQVNLFVQQKKAAPAPQVDWNWRPPADVAPTAKATVVCGMTLVPADPKMDPGIRAAAPDSRVSYTLRTVQPEICKTK